MCHISNHLKQVYEDNQGFSLIEAMVALVIFVIGILGAYQLQIHSTMGNALANRVSVSANWATYAVEELLSKQYESDDLVDTDATGSAGFGVGGLDDIGDDADGALYIQTDGSTTVAETGNDLYSIFWNIAQGDNNNETGVMNDVKQIRLHIVRNGGIGKGLLYSHDYFKAKWPEAE